ncbi:MAG: hypothetical protein AAGJ35_08740 [Myxococcota bacterium]
MSRLVYGFSRIPNTADNVEIVAEAHSNVSEECAHVVGTDCFVKKHVSIPKVILGIAVSVVTHVKGARFVKKGAALSPAQAARPQVASEDVCLCCAHRRTVVLVVKLVCKPNCALKVDVNAVRAGIFAEVNV